MVNTLDVLTGRRFGVLEVLEKAPRGRGTATLWRCRCSGCGAIIDRRRDHLLHGKFDRCRGHHRRGDGGSARKPVGHGNATDVLGTYRSRARAAGLPFLLSRERFVALTQLECHYCGAAPAQVAARARFNGPFVYNGIDRVDSSLGYVEGNCVPCCRICNTMKTDLPLDVFLGHVKRIVARSCR